ncbi:PF04239 family protein [Lachnoanaerobaculum saburreum F0468]|uniref:PF04239 family protein n=1 Tax=Lachnoanaerobaculum saburreum F0468 TaxID=1095750 RepID=I0R6F9_9FIRM|nr:YetF domain-containing protein [Lachnoanaerobaculum saburreum]EIC95267.1 PF04239 family protein [Lachnoanaerobaculum saburreum F0468]
MNIYLLVGIKFILGILIMILQIHILGKHEFSVNTPLNQIQNYVLGGIIGGVIYNTSISILTFLIFILVWSLVVIIVKLMINIGFIKSLVVGNPITLVKNGKVNVANCAKVGISAEQLMLTIRTEGLDSTEDIKSAIMETNGKLTIIDMKSSAPKFPLISNGKINEDILELIGHDENWVNSKLKERGIDSTNDVFLGEYVKGRLILTTYSNI